MKGYTVVLLAAVLSMLGIQTASAQQTQDALYIYRNDGGFNAFFFGDIHHIEYSKIDTLGVEQDDYVVQEVYALDTLFRIPLNAIDSVAFVTPENKIKADVFCPDKSIADYIVASDSVYWIRLAKNTPAALIPKLGDKLLIEEESKYIPDGFGGLVTSVDESGDGFTVMTSALALTDVYEYLFVKVAGASEGMKKADARRRVLEGDVYSYAPEDPIVLPPISKTISLTNSTAFLPDESPLQIDANLQGAITTAFDLKMRIRAFLTITPFTGIEYDQNCIIDINNEETVSLTGGVSARFEVPFLPIPNYTFKLGKLKFQVGTGLFVEGSATALSFSYKKTRHDIIHTNFSASYGKHDLAGPSWLFKYHGDCLKDTTEWDFSATGSLSFGIGLYAGAESKFKVPIEKLPKIMQEWLEVDTLGFNIGIGAEIGMKLDYQGPLWEHRIFDSPEKLLQSSYDYPKLNSADVSTSGYAKLSASLNVLKWTLDESPEVTWYKGNHYGLVPNITGIDVDYDNEEPLRSFRIKAESPIDRDLLMGGYAGFAVFDEDNHLIEDWCGHYRFRDSHKPENQRTTHYSRVFTTLDPVKDKEKTYTIYPQVEFKKSHVLTDLKKEFTVDPAHIDIDEHLLHVGSEMGSMEISVRPNMSNVVCTPKASWLKCFNYIEDRNGLDISWQALPEGVKERKAKILIEGKTSKTNELIIEDSVIVYQWVAYADVTPSKMKFDVKGGTQTATITGTNLTDYKLTCEYSYIHPTLKDKTITVTVDPSTAVDARGGAIYLEGTLPNGEHASFDVIFVEQEGTGEAPDPGVNVEWPDATLLNNLKAKGMPIYEGTNPPKVDGAYEMAPVTYVYTPQGDSRAQPDRILKFSKQSGGFLYYTQCSKNGNGYIYIDESGLPASIIGDGNKFTLCCPYVTRDIKQGYIISGEVESGVIKNLYAAYFVFGVDGFVIYKDGDGVSNPTEWPVKE